MFQNYPIRLIQNETQGRYVIADRDLDVGEVVLKAKSYIAVCSEPMKRVACHCCVKLFIDVLAHKCELCREVYWCSDKCKNETLKSHDIYECKFYRSLRKPSINKEKFDTETFTEIRMLVSMLGRYYYHNILGNPEEVGGEIPDSKDPLSRPYLTNQLESVFELVENQITEESNSLAKRLIDSLVIYAKDLTYDVLCNWKIKKGLDLTEEEKNQFEKLQTVVRPLIVKIRCNQFGIWSKKDKCIGVAVSPVSSYFNHSCFPNCVDIRDGKYMVFRALYPIKKDTPICISYLELESPFQTRFFDLLFSYFFRCRCLRCLDTSGIVDDYVLKFTCRTSPCSGQYYFNHEKYQLTNTHETNPNSPNFKYNQPIDLICSYCQNILKVDKNQYFQNCPNINTIKLKTEKQLNPDKFDLD